jgi:hypothetical protein
MVFYFLIFAPLQLGAKFSYSLGKRKACPYNGFPTA